MLTRLQTRAVAACAVVVACLGIAFLGRAYFQGAVNVLGVSLAQPDILIRSQRLADLPGDVVRSPVWRAVLTQDVVHYYEDHPARLSVVGTLKRLAYDHELAWSDQLAAQILSVPAELSLWRDGKGRPEHFMLVLHEAKLASALQQLARVALPDSQLSLAGELRTAHGTARVHALKVSTQRVWLVVSLGARLVVLSDPGMLLDADRSMARDSSRQLIEVLEQPAGQVSPQAASFGLPRFAGLHQEVVARGDYLSFGYQPFFPGLKAVRVALRTDHGGWDTSAWLTPASLKAWRDGASALWRSIPRGHALCVALPMDWSVGSRALASVAKPESLALFKDLDPVAATCWNAGGGLDAPMLAARLQRDPVARDDEAIGQLLLDVTPKLPASGAGGSLTEMPPLVRRDVQPDGRARLWVRKVPHELGNEREEGVLMNKVGVVRLGRTVLATVDADSLGHATAVSQRTYPALGDELRGPGTPIVVLDGPLLAQLLDQAVWQTLSPEHTPTFHRVARQLLPARLQAVRNLGRWRVSLPDGEAPAGQPDPPTWVALDVRPVR